MNIFETKKYRFSYYLLNSFSKYVWIFAEFFYELIFENLDFFFKLSRFFSKIRTNLVKSMNLFKTKKKIVYLIIYSTIFFQQFFRIRLTFFRIFSRVYFLKFRFFFQNHKKARINFETNTFKTKKNIDSGILYQIFFNFRKFRFFFKLQN